jgi:hypothetical protein
MLRMLLIALGILIAMRIVARLITPGSSALRGGAPSGERDLSGRPASAAKPALSPAERERLEAERELALREGRQIDAIKLHRQLTGLDLADAKDEIDAMR